ncbi:hypothetical protein [Streptococcus caballi]|uniref:hypothetical protein n=1 Tax=Streptococcus caballi TaxID=439220 RepID=UPI0003717E0E|nr:hypothetical protein [Streptococcus caballi]
MKKNLRSFPLIADGETVIEPPKQMALYDNEDLITNIRGQYQDKDYNDVTKNYDFLDETVTSRQQAPDRLKTHNEGKSYAKLAREQAKQDIKKKRQTYLTPDIQKAVKADFQKNNQVSGVNKTKKVPQKGNHLVHLAEQLRQEDYILAELPVTYQKPNNQNKQKPKKNNYDFLKRSQIYNKEENRAHRERQVAQELNLTPFSEQH